MAQDLKKLARNVVAGVGGAENVTNLTRCMIHLRFILKDESKADDTKVKNIPGVMGLVKQGGQYQVIIGNNVAAAYKQILPLFVDTFSLNGETFTAKVAAGDRVAVGNELFEADLDAIKAVGLPTTTMVVITNSHQFKDIAPVEPGHVSFKEHVMGVFHHDKEADTEPTMA